MKKVVVKIEETVVQDFEIKIDDEENEAHAIDKAICKYRAGELVLEPGEVQFRQISVSEPYTSKWIVF